MSTPGYDIKALLERCRETGIVLGIERGQLIADAPQTPEADDLLARVVARKPEVLAALSWPPVAREVDDPRKDIDGDSNQWRRLLRLALIEHGAEPAGTYAALHVVRSLGARLERNEAKAWRIVPGTAYTGEWAVDRLTCLLPHRKAIAALIARLDDCDPGIPLEGE